MMAYNIEIYKLENGVLEYITKNTILFSDLNLNIFKLSYKETLIEIRNKNYNESLSQVIRL